MFGTFLHRPNCIVPRFHTGKSSVVSFSAPKALLRLELPFPRILSANLRVNPFRNHGYEFFQNATDPEDVAAANRYQDFQLGSFANSLFLGQDYPDSWKKTFANETEIFFSAEELKNVSKKSDFLGIDPYTYTVITPPENGIAACQGNTSHSLWPMCVNQTLTSEDGWKGGYRSESYVYTTPVEIRQFLSISGALSRCQCLWLNMGSPSGKSMTRS